MSTLLDEPPTHHPCSCCLRLRATMAAVRRSFTWFGVRKSLSPNRKAEAADTFGAEGNYLSAGKKLFDTRHPAFRAVTAVRNRAVSLWKGMSLPYPEPGIRLIRQDDISAFDVQMTTLGGAEGGRQRARPALCRTEIGGPGATGPAVQLGRLPRLAAGTVSSWNTISRRSSRPITCAAQPGPL